MPMVTGEPANPKRVADYESRMANGLDDFQQLWLTENEYITGNNISAADIWAACEIEQPRMILII